MPHRAHQLVVHHYRAVVSHMDVWRQRMDATTNWAAATAAGMIAFGFATTTSPHAVILLALGFQSVFLLMEARRYQVFDLWRRRFRTLNRTLVAPVLAGEGDELGPDDAAALAALARDLGRTVPHLDLLHALGFRIRRNYGYLFAGTLLAWALKVEMHPAPTTAAAEFLRRAAVAVIPGPVVVASLGVFAAGTLILALSAPSEGMLDWSEVPNPWRRMTARRWWPLRRNLDAGGGDGA
jgi:uncharacterized membrane protein